jgi:(E)-benzylidenesuccinyl-CoA hydratase
LAICAIVTMPPVALRMMKEFVVRFGDLPADQAWDVQNQENNARPSCIYFS